jgi:hypothetical protein
MRLRLSPAMLLLICLSAKVYGNPVPSSKIPDPFIKPLVQTAERVAGAFYQYDASYELQDGALSLPDGIIIFNPRVLRGLPPTTRVFVLLHEMGHQQLGHTTTQATIDGLQQPWLRPEMEFAADRFAVKKMRQDGVSVDELIQMAQDLFQFNQGDRTHPTGQERIDSIKRALQGTTISPTRRQKQSTRATSSDTSTSDDKPTSVDRISSDDPEGADSPPALKALIDKLIVSSRDGFRSIRAGDGDGIGIYGCKDSGLYPGISRGKSRIVAATSEIPAYISYTAYHGSDPDRAIEVYHNKVWELTSAVPNTWKKDDNNPSAIITEVTVFAENPTGPYIQVDYTNTNGVMDVDIYLYSANK